MYTRPFLNAVFGGASLGTTNLAQLTQGTSNRLPPIDIFTTTRKGKT
jgi:hypothetical protein